MASEDLQGWEDFPLLGRVKGREKFWGGERDGTGESLEQEKCSRNALA